MNAIVLDVADIPWEDIKRGRKIDLKRKQLPLDSGIPGVTCELSYLVVPDGYQVPRHRHNCDQIRFILEGIQSIGPRLDMGPMDCGYFPEGVHYGPQEQKGDCTCLLLQFQGPSGTRLLTSDELDRTYRKMIAEGAVFEGGIYRGKKPDGTPENKDSYTAIWEAHEGRKLVFPKPRYREPTITVSEEFSWVADPKRPGVATRHLGTFNEQRTSMNLTRLAPGARLAGGTRDFAEIRFLVSGGVRYGTRECRAGTYFYIPVGTAADATEATSESIIFSIELPMLAMLRR